MILREKQIVQVSRRAAFTLMEMMVVVAIVVVLAGLGGYYVMGQMTEANKKAAKVQCKTLKNAINMYQLGGSEFPGDLNVLKQKGPKGQEPAIDKGTSLNDPWNSPYIAEKQGDTWVVYSNGPPGTGVRISSDDQ